MGFWDAFKGPPPPTTPAADPRNVAAEASARAAAERFHRQGYEDGRNQTYRPPPGPSGFSNPFRAPPVYPSGQPRSPQSRVGGGRTPELQGNNTAYDNGYVLGHREMPLGKRKWFSW